MGHEAITGCEGTDGGLRYAGGASYFTFRINILNDQGGLKIKQVGFSVEKEKAMPLIFEEVKLD